MKHTPEKKNEMTRSIGMLPVILIAVITLILGAAAPKVWAAERVEFDEAEIFFEFNSTDLDLGLHIFFDAEAWKEVEVKDKSGEEIFEVENDGSLNEIGSTEVFTESAEPQFCDDPDDPVECTDDKIAAAIAAFQARFPEGRYRFRGRTVEGKRLRGWAYLSHELPAAPVIVLPEEDDTLDPEEAEIEWQPGVNGAPVVRYEVVVEFEEEETERVFKFVVQVPADPVGGSQTMTVPKEFFDSIDGLEGEYKAEVLAMAESRNATITEREFELQEE
jgi:hypothetical protein